MVNRMEITEMTLDEAEELLSEYYQCHVPLADQGVN